MIKTASQIIVAVAMAIFHLRQSKDAISLRTYTEYVVATREVLMGKAVVE